MFPNVDAGSSDVFDNRQMNIVMLQQLLRDGRFTVAQTFIKVSSPYAPRSFHCHIACCLY
jgi:hypothetical protein